MGGWHEAPPAQNGQPANMAASNPDTSFHLPHSRNVTVTDIFRRTFASEDIISVGLLWAIRFALVLLFFTSSVVTTSTVFPFIVGKAMWSRSLIEIIVGLYVLLAIYSPDYRPRRSRLVVFLGLHLAAVFIAGVFGSSFNLSFWSSYERMGGIFDLAHWVALASVLIFVIRGIREWKILISIYLGISWTPAVVALGENFEYKFFDWVGVTPGTSRVSGSAGNPAFLAGQMLVNGMLAFALLADHIRLTGLYRSIESLAYSAFLALTTFVSVWVLIETGTRGSMAGLVAGLAGSAGIYVLYASRGRVRVGVAIAGILVPIVVILLFVGRDTSFVRDLASRNQIVDRVVSISLTGGGLELRTTGLRMAGQAFVARPLTGLGGENFEVAFQRFQKEGEIAPGTRVLDRAHNKPMNLLATTGIIGFATYMSVWGWLGYLAWQRVRHESGRRVFHSLMAGGVIALFIHNLFLFDTAVTFLLFGLIAAWASMRPDGSTSDNISIPRLSRMPFQVGQSLRMAAPILVAVVIAAGVYGINYRSYRSAQLITETGSSVEEVIGNLEYFSPLATFGRERLLNVMSSRWETLNPTEQLILYGLVPHFLLFLSTQGCLHKPNSLILFTQIFIFPLHCLDMPPLRIPSQVLFA